MSELRELLSSRCRKEPDGCWLWTGYVRKDGYAILTRLRDGSPFPFYAHRLAYEAHVGPIPEGLQIDHLCRIRHCINPAHLEPVTIGKNVLRGVGVTSINARKTHCKHGHEFSAENTHFRPNGGRTCRECDRIKNRRRAARRAAA